MESRRTLPAHFPFPIDDADPAARPGAATPRPLATIRRDGDSVVILDQTALPFRTVTRRLATLADVADAISSMQVRGAPLIGATAAFGVAIAMSTRPTADALSRAVELLARTRPTAVNLGWALHRMAARLRDLPDDERARAAWSEAEAVAAEDAATCRAIGGHGATVLAEIARERRGRARVLTHCNAGWLAACGIGTALAPVFTAFAGGVDLEVIVSETRPRNQGLLTAWELRQAQVPHLLVADNAAGHLLATGQVDAVIVGADRIAANGDTANKVGTFLKALAAASSAVPFYVAAPSSTLDFACRDASAIPIEDRGAEELLRVRGADDAGEAHDVRLAPEGTRVLNPAFDITPARLITAFITERGLIAPAALAAAFPERTP